jgi:hypothetical protein
MGPLAAPMDPELRDALTYNTRRFRMRHQDGTSRWREDGLFDYRIIRNFLGNPAFHLQGDLPFCPAGWKARATTWLT